MEEAERDGIFGKVETENNGENQCQHVSYL
jgi:hypothetical protein